MSPVVELSQAVCLLSSFPALAGADLAVDEGEIVLLEGPNGAGKSTLLKLVAGLLPLHRGRGRVLGLDLAVKDQRRHVRRSVAYLGHQSALYDDLTVAENLAFWVAANRADRTATDRSVGGTAIDPAILDHLGLGGRLGAVPVRGLSAGQRRRVSMAIVVARRSPVWLLDEPHAGLDPSGRDVIDRLVTEAAAAGVGVILSSHELDRARDLAHRRLLVVGGQVHDPNNDTPGPNGAAPCAGDAERGDSGGAGDAP